MKTLALFPVACLLSALGSAAHAAVGPASEPAESHPHSGEGTCESLDHGGDTVYQWWEEQQVVSTTFDNIRRTDQQFRGQRTNHPPYVGPMEQVFGASRVCKTGGSASITAMDRVQVDSDAEFGAGPVSLNIGGQVEAVDTETETLDYTTCITNTTTSTYAVPAGKTLYCRDFDGIFYETYEMDLTTTLETEHWYQEYPYCCHCEDNVIHVHSTCAEPVGDPVYFDSEFSEEETTVELVIGTPVSFTRCTYDAYPATPW